MSKDRTIPRLRGVPLVGTDDGRLLCLQPSLEPELREAIASCKAGIEPSKR